jgi:hypothetical protein
VVIRPHRRERLGFVVQPAPDGKEEPQGGTSTPAPD